MYGYIYMWINKINNHKYIGKHKYDKLEWDQNYITSGKLIKQKMIEYGIENFERVMLDVCDSLEELNEAERYWIAEFETYIGWNKGGYNLTLGGDGCDGIEFSEDYKENMSVILSKVWENENLRKHQSKMQKQRYENPEERVKQSIAQKQRYENIEERRKTKEKSKKYWDSHPEKREEFSIKFSGNGNPNYKYICPLIICYYINVKNLTIKETAKIFNIDQTTLSRKLKEFGITKKHSSFEGSKNGRYVWIPKDVLYEMRIIKKMTHKQIASELSIKTGPVVSRLREYGIENLSIKTKRALN